MPQIHIVTKLRQELFPRLLELSFGAAGEDHRAGLYKVFNNIAFGVIFDTLQSKQ
jgi:hypothetical protein